MTFQASSRESKEGTGQGVGLEDRAHLPEVPRSALSSLGNGSGTCCPSRALTEEELLERKDELIASRKARRLEADDEAADRITAELAGVWLALLRVSQGDFT